VTVDAKPIPFATDRQLAERIRRVAERLHDDPAAAELLEVARILDPDGARP
jgi:hypothetical protein